jgi:FG-GAP-like repeat
MIVSAYRCATSVALIVVLALATPGMAREKISAPEPLSSPATSLALDHVPSSGEPVDRTGRAEIEGPGHSSAPEKAGGVSILLANDEVIDASDLAVAANGDLYAVTSIGDADPVIEVHRSQDGGATWVLWGSLDDTGGAWLQPQIVVAEGTVSRCYIVSQRIVVPTYQKQIHIASSDLSVTTANFSSATSTVMNAAGVDFAKPRFVTDHLEYDDYYLYVVAEGDEDLGTDIWFARSIDLGVTWETPYTIATMNVADRHYLNPVIDYGQSGRLHVAWNFEKDTVGMDAAIRARNVPNWGTGGAGAWEDVQALTSSSNGMEEYRPCIAASKTDGQVVITERRAFDNGSYLSINSPGVHESLDGGLTYTETVTNGLSGGLTTVYDLVLDANRSRWIFAGRSAYTADPALVTAPLADPSDWTLRDPFEYLPDGNYMQNMAIVLDPMHSDRVAAVWHTHIYPSGWWDSSAFSFDAEWRGDPGWPVPEPGFPVALGMAPRTDPCLADLDGDGDMEILCGYGYSNVGAWHHDGTPVDGWPISVGGELSPAPIAVGDLTGDGQPVVVIGRVDGYVRAYEPDGTLAWMKWGGNHDYPPYVSIGAFGGPEPRQIVVFHNQNLFFLDSTAEYPYRAPFRNFGYSGHAEAPPAIGDVDGDGLADAVFTLEDDVFAVGMRSGGTYWRRTLAHPASGAPILVDVDDDGDVEVLVTTEKGLAYLLGDDGSDFAAGWPVDTGNDAALTSASVASCLPGGSYEFAFAGVDNRLHLVRKDGSYADGFPTTMPAAIPLAPVLVPVDGDMADLFFGDMAGSLHAWHPKGAEMAGWPQPITPGLVFSPSVGDLDNDGILEAVWLTDESLYACSLEQPVPDPHELWPMAFFDAQRTSCANCPENLVTAVVEQDAASIFSFAAPFPNPVSDQTVFSFTLPRTASVELGIFDLRGRRVASLLQGQMEPGRHIQNWTGRDDRGVAVSSGHYVARLNVDGEVQKRKITLLR